MKKVIVFLIIFAAKSSMAQTPALPACEQAKKLAAAAWKTSARSIDVTYYSIVKDNTKTEEQIRQVYTEVFDKEYGPDEKLTPEMLEQKKRVIQINVDNRLVELRDRRTKCRARFDGSRYRIDNVYGNPDRSIKTIQNGNIREVLQPEKKLDANTPFETTDIETPDANNGFKFYHYNHDLKTLRIEKRKSSRTTIEYGKTAYILNMPNAAIIQMKLGDRKNTSGAGAFDVNETKIKQLCSGTLEGISVKIRPDANEPDTKDRIEISLYNNKQIAFLTSLMICAKDDYSKVYYCQTPNPATNMPPIFSRTCSDFDANGVPHNIIQVQYDGEGNIRLHETYKIEGVRLNITIPKDVFEFTPPADYEVTDSRLPEAQRQAARIENLKKRLKHENSGRRLGTFVELIEHLKNDPAQLKEVAASMLDDERGNTRAVALSVLIRLLKDNPDELRKIAASMQDDEDPLVQNMIAKILRQIESEKKEQ